MSRYVVFAIVGKAADVLLWLATACVHLGNVRVSDDIDW